MTSVRTVPSRWRALALSAGAVASVVGASTAVEAAAPLPPVPPVVSGHAGVVAQASVEFGDGPYQWAVSAETVPAGSATPAGITGSATFLTVTTGAVVAADDGNPVARLAAGEAMFVGSDAATMVAPADAADAALTRIALLAGGEGGVGDPFAPGPGVRDVDLVRDVLDPGGTVEIADSDAAPALVVALGGSLTVTGDPAGDAEITADVPDTFEGALTIANAGSEPASVLVVVVGSLLQATGGSGPSGSDVGTAPGPPDADGDGLSDAEEAERGTMPNDPDTDGDGLTDGDEVHRYGTDPLSSRTDFDHLEDGLEIERGTDPLDEDTDDDGCQDSSDDNPLVGDGDCDGDTLTFDQERQLGTDPANPDTDDDGIDDDMDPEPLTPQQSGGEAPQPTSPPAPPPPTAPPDSGP